MKVREKEIWSTCYGTDRVRGVKYKEGVRSMGRRKERREDRGEENDIRDANLTHFRNGHSAIS